MSLDDRARTPADVAVSEMEKLLSIALGRGGTFADLYFEHETTSSLLLEEGIIRTASAGVTCGLGVRVASGARSLPPQPVAPAPVERRYGESSLGVLSLAERIALVERADRAARAYEPRVEKVFASLAE